MSKQLIRDLDELTRRNVISTETAVAITKYYDEKRQGDSGRLTLILGILGALLLGSGIILILAHNWDDLSKTTRTIIAFIPLLGGQTLSLYSLMRQKGNRGWIESTAIVLFFGVAATISLLAQIYQISGGLPSFLLTWIFLSLPIVYIMPSSVVSLLVLVLATWYVILTGYDYSAADKYPGASLYRYLLIVLALVPHYFTLLRSRGRNAFHWHNWVFACSALIVLGSFVPSSYGNEILPWIAYMSLGGIFYMAGKHALLKDEHLFLNPFRLLALPTMVGILIFWTFPSPWDRISTPARFSDLMGFPFSYLVILLFGAYLFLLVRPMIKNRRSTNDPVSLSSLLFAVCTVTLMNLSNVAMLVFNFWVLVIGIVYLRRGIEKDHLGILNLGLLVIAALVIVRFFDTGISFLWRGLFFILTGAGFFVFNLMIIKNRKKKIQTVDR